MKKIFFGILAMAAFAACSNEEQIAAPQGEAITFGAFVDNSVRADVATDPSYSAANPMSSFRLWGTVQGTGNIISIYEDVKVTGSEVADGSVWTPVDAPVQYWIPTAKYNFAAIVNGDDNEITVLESENYLPKKIEFTQTEAADVDLLYARPEEITAEETNGPVEFTFEHLVSKVKFTVHNQNTEAVGVTYEVNDITVLGAQKGDCTLATKVWDNFQPDGKALLGDIAVAYNSAKEVCVSEKLVIPTGVKLSFTVKTLLNNQEILSKDYVTATEYTLVPGHAYNFSVNVKAGNLISFSVVDIVGWEQEPEQNVTNDLELVVANN